MFRTCLISIFLLTALVSANHIYASGFYLKSIGSVETSGQALNHWWYTGSKPTLSGEGSAGATVTVSIDSVSQNTTVGSDGQWTYTPSTPLSEGDHAVVLTSNGSTSTLTLTTGTGNVNWDAVSAATSSTLPAAGIFWPTLVFFVLGPAFFILAKKTYTS